MLGSLPLSKGYAWNIKALYVHGLLGETQDRRRKSHSDSYTLTNSLFESQMIWGTPAEHRGEAHDSQHSGARPKFTAAFPGQS